VKTKAFETSIPAPLVEAVKNRKCILFVGSGLSVAAGFPTWKTLVAKLMDAAAKAQPNRELGLKAYAKNGDLLTLAEFARSKLSQHDYVMFLKKIFNKPLPSQHVHRLIARQEFTTEYLQNIQAMVYDPKDGHTVVEKVLTELQKLAPFKKPKLYAQPEAPARMVVSEDTSRSTYGKRKSKR
jgi:hypothetical protein